MGNGKDVGTCSASAAVDALDAVDVACGLFTRQLASQADAFEKQGGFRERLPPPGEETRRARQIKSTKSTKSTESTESPRAALKLDVAYLLPPTFKEFESLRCQIGISKPPGITFCDPKGRRGGRLYRPYAFTGQGVAMLSGVLCSTRAGRPRESYASGVQSRVCTDYLILSMKNIRPIPSADRDAAGELASRDSSRGSTITILRANSLPGESGTRPAAEQDFQAGPALFRSSLVLITDISVCNDNPRIMWV